MASRWWAWEQAQPRVQAWAERVHTERYAKLGRHEAEVFESLSELPVVRREVHVGQVKGAAIDAFVGHLAVLASGVAFLRAAASWPAGVVQQVLRFGFGGTALKLLKKLCQEQQDCLALRACKSDSPPRPPRLSLASTAVPFEEEGGSVGYSAVSNEALSSGECDEDIIALPKKHRRKLAKKEIKAKRVAARRLGCWWTF
ncbi:unnamed protein product [Symbiodinium sp. CCMP2456]|nr:unnamed protein product [Symbiodinium sp. CCMP2456]